MALIVLGGRVQLCRKKGYSNMNVMARGGEGEDINDHETKRGKGNRFRSMSLSMFFH